MSKRFYRLQQKLGITKPEAAAMAVLTALFLLGVGVRTWQSHGGSDSSFDYTEVDSLFAVATERMRADLAAPPSDTGKSAAPASPASGAPIDINSAGSAELQQLPRIGPALAGRILEYRSRRGAFRSVDELTRISGIGPKTLETLRPLITASATDSL